MSNLQEVFIRIQQTKHERKDIQVQYKDALNASSEYKEIVEKIRGYKLRKKQIEDEAKAELGGSYERAEFLKKDIQNDQELLADLALNQYLKGESIEVKDGEDNVYEPIFKVSFKRTNQLRPAQ